MIRWKGPVIWIGVALLFMGSFYLVNRYVPPQHLGWKRLDTSRPLGLATKAQILRLSLSSSASCMDMARDTIGFESIPADPKPSPEKGNGAGVCGFDIGRVVYGQDDISLTPGEANMQCPLSIGAYLWSREIDQIAQERYGYGLAKIHHIGTYSCRRQNGNSSGLWSEHAFANAWDVSGFELENGHLVTVLAHWDTVDQDAAFLRDIREAACKIFRVTLSPDYNAAHRDHFHVDMGPSSTCR
ncbi:extensin-like protein [Litorimonas taeanensis]|uniref:Extensin-like protein n=1 Tax=Litorimonas taeanensis TaxID=568099 RepID=A0A420WDC9_9PROT|nr:extensin family protein [Litorimonas taeanensis]RKQ68996.1 extensin-like protein [Litorimonas taeanensis]